ncbi:hypothetical protein [Rheinheimera texasensis]|uniref:hypothetical protein n=1 Tax=Rheinheimera texasensis TaxID=306205 RepID=UPI0032B27108
MKQQNIERKQLPAIQCEDFTYINESIAKYRKESNKLLSVNMLNRASIKHCVQPHIINALAISHERSHQNASTNPHYLTQNHLLIADQLNNPVNWQLYPTVDGLSFTLDASDTELKRLERFFNVKNKHPKLKMKKDVKSKKGKKSEKGSVMLSYEEEIKERNLYKKTVQVHLRKEDCEHMRVSLGLKGDKKKNKMRPVRFSFNPARFKGKQLRKLFQLIREADVFNDFNKTLSDANVTRVDIAIDLIGVPTPMIIATQGTAVHYSSHPKPGTEENDEKPFVETMYSGAPKKSHFTLYSKVDKQEQRKQTHVVIIKGPDEKPLSLVRGERVYKPQHSGSKFKLKDLEKAPSLFKSLKFYSPLAYCRLDEDDKGYALKFGYPLSQMVKNSDWSELSKFFSKKELELKKRTAPDGTPLLEKRESQERRLAKKKMLKELTPFELPINHEWFEEKQRKFLKKILELMFNKDHG